MERGRGGGACRWPGGPIPLGVDGAYEGWCDSWDSFCSAPPKADFQLGGCSTLRRRVFHLSLIRADVQGRGLGSNIVHMFCVGQGVRVTLGLGSIDGEKGCVNIYR